MSIVVGVRVRPFNQREKQRESQCCIDMPGGNQTKIFDDTGKEKTFTFDHSFWSHDGYRTLENGYMEPEDDKYADQKIVFDTVGKQILDNAWQGYHCCLFAYGQTGAGKSYSMVGYGENKGIVPISCNEIFRRIGENKDPDKSYEVQVSMLEIYNEKVQDLLINPNKRPQSGLKIRESKVLGIFVDGLSKHPVTSYDEISRKMDDGYNNRTIGSTLMNATSSRAHTIVTIEFKQLTMVAKKKSEKLSMINLVDLAGSERSGSTGATGDRLKEGCNINKSLLILGNVINCLADKAIGKNKNMLPPYRDSALTRILQNALGGNSKTVMICALSPASINYEETLSTLRYADRAKKIQNKAVINESEHDKMVRLLKEENVNLKKLIEDLQKKIGGGGGTVSSADQQAFLELKEQYEANQKVMGDMQKTFEEKLEEAKKHEGENIGQRVDIKLPHLVVLNEDPQLSYKLKYPLNELPVYVGRKNGNPEPQIKLSGIGIKQNHAAFYKQGDEILLKPHDKESQKYIYINGKKIAIDGQIVHTKDRIVFGNNTIFIYMKKSTGDDIYSIDWENAQMELQKEIELENKRQIEETEKKKQDEINLLKKDYEEEYSKRKKEIEEKLRKQVEEYEMKLKEINQNAEKQRIEQERLNQEKKLKERMKQLEEEKVRKRREIEIKEKEEKLRREQLKKEQDNIHNNSERLENNLTNILKKIQKMNIIITELKRNINLEAILQKNLVEEIKEIKNGSNIAIRVENFEEGTVYYWTPDIFHNRYDLMKELFNKFNDDELDLQNLKKEDDPLWDEPKPVLLGYSFYKLEPLSYLISNKSELAIISPNGNMIGKLEADVFPHDDEGNEFEEVPENPNELIGQCLQYKICIYGVKNIPKNFSNNLKVEFQNLQDHSLVSSKIYNKIEDDEDEDENDKKDKNIVDMDEESVSIQINEEFEYKIDYITKEDIEYLEKNRLCFKLYAVETVEKKGRTLFEEMININRESEMQQYDYEKEKKEEMKNQQNEMENGFINIDKPTNEEIIAMENGKGKKKKKGKKDDCLIY